MKLSGSESGDLKMERIALQEMVKASFSPPPRRRAGGCIERDIYKGAFAQHPSAVSGAQQVTRITPNYGGINGGMRLTIEGEGFAQASQFSLNADDPNVGNSVTLVSQTRSIPCDVEKYSSHSKKIMCYTRALPEDDYDIRVTVDGVPIPSSLMCTSWGDYWWRYYCRFQSRSYYTPTIDSLSPLSGLPGTVVTIRGRIMTDVYGSSTDRTSNGRNTRFVRAYMGGMSCELIKPNSDEKSLPDLGLFSVSALNKLAMFQTYAEVTGVFPSVGSVLGGTALTIQGRYFDETDSKAVVLIGGKPHITQKTFQGSPAEVRLNPSSPRQFVLCRRSCAAKTRARPFRCMSLSSDGDQNGSQSSMSRWFNVHVCFLTGVPALCDCLLMSSSPVACYPVIFLWIYFPYPSLSSLLPESFPVDSDYSTALWTVSLLPVTDCLQPLIYPCPSGFRDAALTGAVYAPYPVSGPHTSSHRSLSGRSPSECGSSFRCLCVFPVSAVCPGSRGVKMEMWNNSYPSNLTDILNYNASMPGYSVQWVDSLSYVWPAEMYNFVARLSGFFVPTETDNYYFLIKGYSICQLYFSQTGHPKDKVRIAYQPQNTNSFFSFGFQKSKVMRLEKGKSYYIEVIMNKYYYYQASVDVGFFKEISPFTAQQTTEAVNERQQINANYDILSEKQVVSFKGWAPVRHVQEVQTIRINSDCFSTSFCDNTYYFLGYGEHKTGALLYFTKV
ncbi:fibrocystin-L-like [Misgurnus anguillicaudatus]|uniref:fibrocystin-L-like n=1 Tax=Misgurnus anguillicaudatus TaxID=75329 RepID=UPI003CCF781C